MCNRPDKKTFRKRTLFIIAAALTAILLLIILLGYREKEYGGNPEDQSASVHEPVTILTGGMDYTEFEKKLKKAYPEIKLKFVSYCGNDTKSHMLYTLEAGDAPDIYTTTYPLSEETQRENLIDMSAEIEVKDYNLAQLSETQINGAIYLLPSNFNILGIYYNKTLMEENGWEVPQNFEGMKQLVHEIKEKGLNPSLVECELPGSNFSYLFDIANTDFLYTPKGIEWKNRFLKGEAAAKGSWEETIAYVQEWIDCGLLAHNCGESGDSGKIEEFYKGNTVFYFTREFDRFTQNEDGTGDCYGIMPWLSKDGESNLYVKVVNRYYGLNKRLLEKGNEQKYEDAKKVLKFIFSDEGQKSLADAKEGVFVEGLRNAKISEDSPFFEAQNMLKKGFYVPITYRGWENKILDIDRICEEWFSGRCTGEDVINALDELGMQSRNIDDDENAVKVKDDFSLEQTGRLVARVMAEETGADIGIISLGAYRNGEENPYGVNGKLYKGSITEERGNTILPAADYDGIAVMMLSGKEIKEMMNTGFDLYGNNKNYPYVCFIKNGKPLVDYFEYVVAINVDGYTEETGRQGQARSTDKNLVSALSSFLEKNKELNPKDYNEQQI